VEPVNREQQLEQIEFENGRHALMIRASRGDSPYELIERLKIRPPEAIILVCGGADSLDASIKERLELVFNRGVVRAAADRGAALLDGGTQSGVMALLGKAVAEQEDRLVLLGVSPSGKVYYPGVPKGEHGEHSAPLDPNHTHFVLADGNTWGSETATLFSLADALSKIGPEGVVEARQGLRERVPAANALPAAPPVERPAKTAPETLPVVTILAGGNPEGIALKEVRQSVRRGWPVIVLEGSGGLADELACLLRERPADVRSADLLEIIEEGNLQLYSISQPPAVLRQQILRQLGENELLTLAWKRYGLYTTQARRHRSTFQRLQKSILWLGVVTTFFVVLQSALQAEGAGSRLQFLTPQFRDWLSQNVLHYVVLILPILTATLIAVSARLNAGNKWVLLRSSTEAVKREIYLYRTRPMVGITPEATNDADSAADKLAKDGEDTLLDGLLTDEIEARRESELYRRLEQVDNELMQSDVVTSALPEYTGKIPPGSVASRGDDGRSFLTPQRYIYLRLDDQLEYYRKRTQELEHQARRLQGLAIGIGALGTFLAAVRLELWVALTTAGVTALTAYLQYEQTENTLVRYNHAASNLDNIKIWWASLTPAEQADPRNVRSLVETTERVLESESRSWLQQMREALADLSKRPTSDEEITRRGKVK